MASQFISQKVLAKKLRLSSSTVSLALAESPKIPLVTRMRIQTLARKMGYKTNRNAVLLVNRRWAKKSVSNRPNIAYMQSLIYEGFTDPYLPGLLRQADILGYNLDILKSGQFASRDHLNKVLFSRGIQGVIVGQTAGHFRTYLPTLEKIAVVQCGLYLPVEIHTLVRSDLDAVVKLCFEKVRAQGFRRIGMILLQDPKAESDQILESSTWNLKRLWPDNIELFVEEWDFFDSHPESLKKWFYRHKCDAVVGITATVDDFLQKLGIKVPFASMILEPLRPEVDGADLQGAIMGEMSINLLDSYLRQNLLGISSVKKVFMVEPTWHEGTSLSRRRLV